MRTPTATTLISELAIAVLAAIDTTTALFEAEVPPALVSRVRERTRSFAVT